MKYQIQGSITPRSQDAARHLGTLDQHRDHPHVTALQRRGDFQAGIVIGVFETTLTAGIRQTHPAWPDEREQDTAALQSPINRFNEIDTRVDGLDIAKNRRAVQLFPKMVGQPPGGTLTVLAAVADENAFNVCTPP